MKISCRDYALRLLGVKDRTESELSARLEEKGYDPVEVADAMEFVINYGFIDDEAYARRYLSDSINLRGHGERRVRAELLRRGISRDIVEKALSEVEEGSEEDRMNEIFERRFFGADLSSQKERNRIFAYFARRGFDPHEIWGMINRKSSFNDVEWGE